MINAKLKKSLEINFPKQRRMSFLIALFSLLIYICLYSYIDSTLAYSWIFGLLVGFTLQRSRICFTAALRDPILFGMTELARAIILSLFIMTIGYFLIQIYQLSQGLPLPGRFVTLGWHIPIGALIFGIGAALSGGCASGTLVRIGEGFRLQWIALLGFIFGSTHGAYDGDRWYRLFTDIDFPHLPNLIGWRWAILIQLLLLIILYVLAYLWEKYKFG
ncbi:YeeE/YedE thiosulfate transporter family protein [Halonatronum saccharophilum]|uniref:YeeE/YedE thiosulfate transporter family protein n=1 Tax=Halonatronum saccharophilum TaxID=150060 RepID=UPI0004B2ADF0|nr:YeeE/YedE thiosulfate transporter family protein [Halonatronum saccharophilum]